MRVQLLRTGDRTSLTLEMTAEPKKAALLALSARALEVEVGPVTGPIFTAGPPLQALPEASTISEAIRPAR